MRLVSRFVIVAAAVAVSGAFSGLSAQEKASGPDEVVLSGAALGSVKFTHAKHTKFGECTSCHHASKEAKPLTSEYQKCQSCHTKEAEAPMTTNAKAAFHNTTDKTGTCLSCHAKAVEEGKVAPMKCGECHKKE